MKQLTITLGGQSRVLDVGKFWFQKFYGEATGIDPLNSTDVLVKPEKQFDLVVAIVYAGLRTYYKSQKLAEDFSLENVQDWVGELEGEQVSDIVNQYAGLNKSKEAGEAPPQAENV